MKCRSRNPAKSPGSIENFFFFLEITHTCPPGFAVERLYQPRAIKYLLPNFGETLGGKTGDGGGKGHSKDFAVEGGFLARDAPRW